MKNLDELKKELLTEKEQKDYDNNKITRQIRVEVIKYMDKNKLRLIDVYKGTGVKPSVIKGYLEDMNDLEFKEINSLVSFIGMKLKLNNSMPNR